MRRRTNERVTRLGHLTQQRRHMRALGRFLGTIERRLRHNRAQRAQRQLGRRQLRHRQQGRRDTAPIQAGQSGCRFIEAAEQE